MTLTGLRVKVALGAPEPASARIKTRHARYPVIARLGNSSDLKVFRQIFVNDEYACMRNISGAFILDLGANVGFTSAYFLSRFPAAKVLAVEPDPGNFEQCRQNLAPYGDRAKVLLGAAWSTHSRLALSPGTLGEWGIQVVEGEGQQATVEAWDVPGLLQLAGEEQIDLLKVDIERSELQVFGRSSSSWLPRVRNICIELHGEDCKCVFFEALKEFEYDLECSGELTITKNLRPRPNPNQGI